MPGPGENKFDSSMQVEEQDFAPTKTESWFLGFAVVLTIVLLGAMYKMYKSFKDEPR
jgi:hypothetical protein